MISDEELVERVFFPVINEACRILDEKIAVKADDLDISSVLGFGFPAYRFVQFLLSIFCLGVRGG